MEKVSKRWFKNNGWKKYEEKYKLMEDQPGYENAVRHTIQYSLYNENIHARCDCIVTVVPPGRYNRKKRVERFYAFWAYGRKNGFHIENRITYRQFTVDQIETACTLCGTK